jgi:hypothetical protein
MHYSCNCADGSRKGVENEAGAAGIVLKRTAVNDLLPAVKAVMEGGTFISASDG